MSLNRIGGAFLPMTCYPDNSISRDVIHRESQAVTPAESETARRYQEHAARGSQSCSSHG